MLLGNPLPTLRNPLRMAEELAEIDLISKGRLVPGWVRGAGSEQIFNNANPAYNREYFNEAHDVVIAAWTRRGRFDGKANISPIASSTRGRCPIRSRTRRYGFPA